MVIIQAVETSHLEQLYGWLALTPDVTETLDMQIAEHNKGNRHYLVAVKDGVVVGTVQFVPRHWNDPQLGDGQSRGYLLGLEVRSEYRQQGIGRQLVRAVEAEALRRGMSEVTLLVEHDNEVARHMYHKDGYVFFKETEDEWQGIVTSYQAMRKRLPS